MINRDKPYYRSKPIASLDALAKTLGVRPSVLTFLSKDTSSHYISFRLQTSPDKVRYLNEPKPILKTIQKRINKRIFSNIDFPTYLQGGIRDDVNPRDYYNNASAHTLAKNIITLDIRSFYDNISEKYAVNIFQCLCKFPIDVAEMLAKLVTYKGKVPQGGVTSSYIANLIFWDKEYKLVDKYRKSNLVYTRLLDDIAISSKKSISTEMKEKIIKEIAGLLRSKDLKLNKKKIKQLNNSKPMIVTGLWVNHKSPKCFRNEKKSVRTAVFECEQEYLNDNYYSDDYHDLWNRTSGRVAKLARVGHGQASNLRERLKVIYPRISDEMFSQISSCHRQLSQFK
jgi:hypothetical protein